MRILLLCLVLFSVCSAGNVLCSFSFGWTSDFGLFSAGNWKKYCNFAAGYSIGLQT
ncbi:hypothetical protein HMPREF9141_0510 [Prevotella multiformis DSM 16608]|uniref:Lipoprotein n=1 Tax=Prevotella multiformis DSM 16608 TaxID=888743 RepID=F0F4J4_9BACT|nr:hypothetical protein HMPREF9141_0510 [Prevotella multiformis DSM 16608]